MQELRIVLIIVGLLAIAALLFHGLWTSRKDSKASKFSDKPIGKLGEESTSEQTGDSLFSSSDHSSGRKRKRAEPEFIVDTDEGDPLLGGYDIVQDEDDDHSEPVLNDKERESYLCRTVDEMEKENGIESEEPLSQMLQEENEVAETETVTEPAETDFDVIVLSVHCAGNHPFVGTQLFESMKQNGLLYGAMDIFHRHSDMSGTGKVLFSVANIMQPGSLKYDDPAEFTTKGISFFMTLPGFGDPEQNFKLMLKTAQQIADDLGGNVIDDKRNLMTPDRLSEYRRQIQQFKARTA